MKSTQHGWTLVEAMISLAVTALALGAAIPGFEAARERRHVDGAAAQLETDLQMARSLAVLQNRTLRVSFRANSDGSCYVIHSGSTSACTCNADGTTACIAGVEALRSVSYDRSLPVLVTSNSASMAFEHVRGTVTPTSTVVISSPHKTVHVITNIMGRIRTCSPTAPSPGYPIC